jgi:beta-mannosidase
VAQRLASHPIEAAVTPADGGYAITVTATAYARDVFCMADKVDQDARVDGGMATLLPGESVTWRIESDATVPPSAFTAENVLRSANDLKR